MLAVFDSAYRGAGANIEVVQPADAHAPDAGERQRLARNQNSVTNAHAVRASGRTRSQDPDRFPQDRLQPQPGEPASLTPSKSSPTQEPKWKTFLLDRPRWGLGRGSQVDAGQRTVTAPILPSCFGYGGSAVPSWWPAGWRACFQGLGDPVCVIRLHGPRQHGYSRRCA